MHSLSFCILRQDYTSILSNLLEVSISLHPISAAIQELEAAAKKAGDEAKVTHMILHEELLIAVTNC